MVRTRIPVPANVPEGLEAVRLSGKTNMFDVRVVIELAMQMGHYDTAFWIYDHMALYVVGIFAGFEPEGGESECADR